MDAETIWNQVITVDQVLSKGACWDKSLVSSFTKKDERISFRDLYFNPDLGAGQKCWVLSKYCPANICFLWSCDCLGKFLDKIQLKKKEECQTFLSILFKRVSTDVSIHSELRQALGIDSVLSEGKDAPPLHLLHALRLFRAFSDKEKIIDASWSIVFSLSEGLPMQDRAQYWDWALRSLGICLSGEREEIEDGACFGCYPL